MVVIYRALELNASGEYANRTESAPDFNSDYTVFVKVNTTADALNSYIFEISNGTSQNRDTLRFHASDHIRASVVVAGSKTDANGSVLSDGWHDVAAVRSGNDFTVYVDGAQDSTLTRDISSRTSASEIAFGRSYENSAAATEDHYAAKLFTRVFTLAEIQREWLQVRQWYPNSEWGIWPDLGDDISRQGNHLTHQGSPAHVDPPNVSWDMSDEIVVVEAAAPLAANAYLKRSQHKPVPNTLVRM